MLVAAFYGFRRGEVLGLKWDAIDFERGTISVIRTVTTITVDGKQTEIEQQSAANGGEYQPQQHRNFIEGNQVIAVKGIAKHGVPPSG
ncbi:hypothetical protein CE91St47_30250 [Eubacteriales bacterium]|nr:hypothetical protein CE91St47_30250 [Eubacteriales bacterium]